MAGDSRANRIVDGPSGRQHSMLSPLAGSVATGLAGQIALIVSGVVAARLLGPEDRGNLALLILIPVAISQLGSLGLPLAVTYEFSKNVDVARGTLWNIRRPAVVLATALVILHTLIVAGLVLDRDPDVKVAALFTLLIIPASTAQLYGLAILQGRRDFGAFNALRLLPALAFSVFAVIAVVLDVRSLPQFALWFSVTYLAAGAATLAIALRRSPPYERADAPRVVEMLRFGTRGLLGSVSPLEGLRLDQAIVGLFLSPVALGLYVVGVSFTNLPRFVAQSIGVVAYPYVAAEQDRGRARRSMWNLFWLSVLVCSAVIVPLEVMAGWLIPAFFGEAYAPAVEIMQILLLSSLFLSARRVLTDASRGFGYPVLGSTAEIASWLALVVCLMLLAPGFGAAGVAAAFTLAAAVSLVVLIALVMRTGHGRPTVAGPGEEPLIDGL